MSQRVDILLVDDHEENLLALEAILVDPSFNLVRASSGRAALKGCEGRVRVCVGTAFKS